MNEGEPSPSSPAGAATSAAAQPVGRRERTVALQPTFSKVLRAVWSFTWKSQLTWRRLPVVAISLLILPVLVYITTASIQAWARRHASGGEPPVPIEALSRRLARAGNDLKPAQAQALQQIYAEELEQLGKDFQESKSPESSVREQSEQMRACHDRIVARARTELEPKQFSQFDNFEARRLERSLARVTVRTWGRTGSFYHWLIDFYFFVILPLVCVASCGALIREELQADTLSFLVTRPVSRARLLLAKYLAQTAWLQMVLLVETLLVVAVGTMREIPDLGAMLPLLLGSQFLAVLAWSALGTLFGLVTKRYMAVAIVYGMIVEMGIGRIPTNINTLSIMRHLKTLLSHNAALQSVYDWPTQGVPLSLGSLVFAVVLFLIVGTLLFTFKEYHHTAEMQK